MISLIRDKRTHGTCLPEPVNVLNSLPASVQYHNHHSIRPAPAIYNISLTPIRKAFVAVLTEIERCDAECTFSTEQVKFDMASLLTAQSDLLLKMASHIDECYLILKALQPPVVVANPHPFTDKWLQQAQHPTVANFKREIEPYRAFLAPLVNRIKHNQSRLRSVMFYWPKVTLPGYFIEGVFPDGAVGPDSEIHKTGGAYSFARDIRTHFSALYLIGNALTLAVRKGLFKQQGVKIKPQIATPEASVEDELLDIARRISRLPEFVFPDENQRVPSVSLFENESTKQLILAPHSAHLFAFPPPGSFASATTEGDGHTRSFRIPYLLGRKPMPIIRKDN